MAEETKQDASSWKAVHLLATINRLSYTANTSRSKPELIFLMLNETIRVVQYQRASLWTCNGGYQILGVSGTSQFDPRSDQFVFLQRRLDTIENKSELKVLDPPQGGPSPEKPSLVWLPIPTEGEEKLGLLLERWKTNEWLEDEKVIIGFLMKNYGSAWNRFTKSFKWHHILDHKVKLGALLLGLIILAFPIDLPISAPAEVVAKEPYIIAAPLEGIIRDVPVTPGAKVQKGDLLFTYDDKEITHTLKSAEEEVGVVRSQLERSYILGMEDQEQREQLGILKHRLKKAESLLSLAEQKALDLKVLAPKDGVVVIDDPEKWRGNPTKVGEKVLTITDPHKSMVKIWIPEGDNVYIDPQKEIKVLLNISPERTYAAQLRYLSSESTLDEHSTPSFVAEAEWVQPPKNQQLGLKGSATLYGPKVSVFYWLMRRPWAFFRSIVGV